MLHPRPYFFREFWGIPLIFFYAYHNDALLVKKKTLLTLSNNKNFIALNLTAFEERIVNSIRDTGRFEFEKVQ